MRTRDADEARSVLSTSYLPLTLAPVSRGLFDVRLTITVLGRLTLGWISFGAPTRVVTQSVQDFHVDLPVTGQIASRVGKRPETILTPNLAEVFSPDQPVELRWSANTYAACIMIGRETMERELTRLLGRELSRPLIFDAAMPMNVPVGRRWRQALQLVDDELRRPSGLLDFPLTRHRLEQIVIDAMLAGQPHTHSDDLRYRTGRGSERHVWAAADLMQASPEHPWSTAELAERLGVSVRTLQAEFQVQRNTTPTAYLRNVRLDRVHDELLAADPSSTAVQHVARHWGFGHLGRFSAYYRSRFGEPPSSTLRRPG